MRQLGKRDRVAGFVRRAIGLQPHPLVVRPRFDELDGWRRSPGSSAAAVESHAPRTRSLWPRPARTSSCPIVRARSAPHEARRGSTAGSSPRPVRSLPRVVYQSIVAAFGAQPCPTIETHLAGAAWIHEDQSFAAEAVEILLDDATDEHRRDAGVERVAALREHLERRRARQRMSSRHRAVAARRRSADRRPAGTAPSDRRPRTPQSTQQRQCECGRARY